MRLPAAIGSVRAALDLLVHAGVSDDGDALLAALEPAPGRRFVSISAHGAGEAAMALASRGADPILAYDVADAASLHRLVTLKTTAAHLLGREDYLAVVGLRPASRLRKRALADQVLRALPEPERTWWAPRRRWLVKGLFRADRQAAFFGAFLAALRPMMSASERRTLLFDPDPARRRAVFDRRVRRDWLDAALGAAGARLNLFFPEAEWRASEYPRALNRDPLGYLEGLVVAGLADNPLFAHLVRDEDEALPLALQPPHLRPGAYDGFRAARPHLRVVMTAPGAALDLSEVPSDLHGAYLSNVVDYLDESEREDLFRQLVPKLGPGAPVLIYSNEAYGKVPPQAGLRMDEAKSEQVRQIDRARIYARIEVHRAPGEPPASPKDDRGPRLRIVS